MSTTKRPLLALLGAIGLLIATVSFATSASAAPYTSQPTLSVSTQTPAVGASLTVSGAGFAAGENVSLTLHTVVYNLGTATTDGSGSFTTTVTLPAGVSGTHTIVALGLGSGRSASITLTIGSGTAGGGGSNGGLPNTGAAVMGVGGLGLALLIGGGLMLLVGRRRSVSAI